MMKKLSYMGVFIMLLFFLGFGLWRKQVQRELLANGQRVRVAIQNVYCNTSGGQSKLYFLDRENKVNHANINHQDCDKYKKGDTLDLMYNEQQDQYFISSVQN